MSHMNFFGAPQVKAQCDMVPLYLREGSHMYNMYALQRENIQVLHDLGRKTKQ